MKNTLLNKENPIRTVPKKESGTLRRRRSYIGSEKSSMVVLRKVFVCTRKGAIESILSTSTFQYINVKEM